MTNSTDVMPFVIRRHESARVIPASVRRKAVSLFEAGQGYVKVAKALDLSPNTVKDWHRQYQAGTFRVTVSDNQKRYDRSTRLAAIALRESGLSWEPFEKETGISRTSCMKWMRAESGSLKTEGGA